jgi:hypothetical protein
MKLPEGWTEHLVLRNNKKVGLFVIQANEIHCLRDDSYAGRWLTRQDLERLTQPIFQKYGYLVTKVSNGNLNGDRFVKRLGFYKIFNDCDNTHYRADKLNHSRV